jgi:MYXO-CTERM domain-containing protein
VGARAKPPGFELPPLPERWANYRAERMRGQGDEGEEDRTEELPESGGEERELVGETGEGEVEFAGDDGDGGPPEVEGQPGATKKGCRVGGDAGPAIGVFALLALGIARRRRRAP